MKQFLIAVLFSLCLAPAYSAPAIKQPTVHVSETVQVYGIVETRNVSPMKGGWRKQYGIATYEDGDLVSIVIASTGQPVDIDVHYTQYGAYYNFKWTPLYYL